MPGYRQNRVYSSTQTILNGACDWTEKRRLVYTHQISIDIYLSVSMVHWLCQKLLKQRNLAIMRDADAPGETAVCMRRSPLSMTIGCGYENYFCHQLVV
ncbi:hypothetical protein TNCV_4460941 [Trichonephila clavipes]|nr:hypothetical protein TNCV_4460941 [Trichonephila clavipes]